MSEAGKIDAKRIIEALLFVTETPLTKAQILGVMRNTAGNIEMRPVELERYIQDLNQEYEREGHSFYIDEIAGGWQLRTRPEYSPWIKNLLNILTKERLSKPALETLAIIAYKQPITRAQIEEIRGVNVDWIINTLLDKGLIRIVGKKDAPGKPFLYGTTTRFLEHFGLKSLDELPRIEEFRKEKGTG